MYSFEAVLLRRLAVGTTSGLSTSTEVVEAKLTMVGEDAR